MNNSLFQDSLKVAEKVITKTSENNDTSNLWMWIAIGEFTMIIGFIIAIRLKRKPNAKKQFKDKSLAQEVDFNNIINSSFHSIELYDILKVKCHPDRFPTDPKLNEIADKLFQEITRSKTNVKRLQELKIEAQHKLNINF
ncbi:molecular chaperone DnaJ [Bizionia gelidisalsuginis]|uniref:Molecular chaperone DnaJ n=1 Tax=Bizionia gelidisalsuginis TaxID=291188 RepID=A0ABY3MBQ7_9FLAO|nr:molecular chaperone DnaJ [Bizionia gelidisalsuginis]TYC14759.1 molecular chaperone DnaJ [Bizionia gelidisalsuginis]